jgi:hypothetical protein
MFSTVCPLLTVPPICSDCWFSSATPNSVFYSLSTVCQCFTQNICWLCVTLFNAVFYILSTICKYLTVYRLVVLCHYVHCSLRNSVKRVSVPHNITSVVSAPLRPLLPPYVCPLSVSTSKFKVFWFCVITATAVLYRLSPVSQLHISSFNSVS